MLPTKFQFIWPSGFRAWAEPLVLICQFQKSSLKPLGQVNRNLVRSIYGRSTLYKDFSFRPDPKTNMAATGNCFSSKDASYQVSVHLAKWFQSRFFSLEISQSETIACGRHVCFRIGTLYKDCSFCPDPLTNMATIGNSFF
jgi:hypothetical protein